MILAFSTSSPLASVALFTADGALVQAGSKHAPMAASGACLDLLDQMKVDLSQVTLFLSDLGPGSFTGVRIGVTFAKTFAWIHGGQCGGAPAFDLIAPTGVVALPSKRGEYFVRTPGSEPTRMTEVPEQCVGYGAWVADGEAHYPNATGFGTVLDRIIPVAAEQLLPEYLMEPAISLPNKPFGRVVSGA